MSLSDSVLTATAPPLCEECRSECRISSGEWTCPNCGLVSESVMIPSVLPGSAPLRGGKPGVNRVPLYAAAGAAGTPPSILSSPSYRRENRRRYYVRLAHTACNLMKLNGQIAEEAARLACGRPVRCRDREMHVLAAVMYVSSMRGGPPREADQ